MFDNNNINEREREKKLNAMTDSHNKRNNNKKFNKILLFHDDWYLFYDKIIAENMLT